MKYTELNSFFKFYMNTYLDMRLETPLIIKLELNIN